MISGRDKERQIERGAEIVGRRGSLSNEIASSWWIVIKNVFLFAHPLRNIYNIYVHYVYMYDG
jgi:hypothetical protein